MPGTAVAENVEDLKRVDDPGAASTHGCRVRLSHRVDIPHNDVVLHVLLLRSVGRPEDADRYAADHVAFLERHHHDGTFLLSGQTVPDSVGEVIFAAGSREQVERLVAEDPFVVAGVAEYEIVTVAPTRLHEDLADLLVVADAGDESWDEPALVRLRQGEIGVLREGRPVREVAQQAGQLLLETGAASAEEEVVRRCVTALVERDWAGDDVLVMELRDLLGEQVTADGGRLISWPLAPVPVDLGDLVMFLDGDSKQGHGLVDLQTGDVYHPGVLDWDRPSEFDEEREDFDPDRWLTFWPESGEGYRDMLDFADDLPEGRLRERLFRALDGRGVFRRFKDVLHEAPEPFLARWHVFSGERELARARRWLALEGYRSDPKRSRR